MTTKKIHRGLIAVIFLVLALIFSTFAIPSFADDAVDNENTTSSYTVDETSKTITVSPLYTADDNNDGVVDEYTSNTGIQDALYYIYNNVTDKDGWTVIVSEGTYFRFGIPSGLDNITIQAATDDDGNYVEVIIPVLDNSSFKVEGFYNEFPDNGGIQLQFSKNVTLKGLTIKSMVVETGTWNQSAITDLCRYDSDKCGDPDYSLTLDGCTFIGSTDINEHAILLGNTTALTVKNCTFSDFYSAISFMEDGYIVSAIIVDSNTFISCDRAIDGYFGGGSSALSESDLGKLEFTNNTVTGTTSMYSKVLLADQYATTETENHDAWGYVTISGNKLENAALILFEMETNLDLDSLIDNNTFGDNTYIAVGSEAQNVITLTYSAESDEDQIGYWELLDTSEMSIVGTSWTDDEIALIKKAVEDVNSTGAHTLT